MKKFIIWDSTDMNPRYDDDGVCTSDGLIGRVTEDNVYLTTYAAYDDETRHSDLAVNEWTSATFSMSGSKGHYRIYRVQ